MENSLKYLERENKLLREAWLAKRRQELVAAGYKVEQARIHAEAELNSAIAEMMNVPPNG